MPSETICKTIRQYNKDLISEADMKKLQEVASDYNKVKNHVYQRYGGVGGLSKIYPGYTVQNEMTASGLRKTLDMPSVYFYLAIFDALGDIKSQWTRTKSEVLKKISQNEGLSPGGKHYLRFVLKVNNAFEAILNKKKLILPKDIQKQYDLLSENVDVKILHNYICRQVRKYHVKLHTDITDGFSIAERAYRYADHGIYISIKEKRKRIFVPLTDNNRYTSQLYIKLYPEQGNVEIKVPVNVSVYKHADYKASIGLSVGMFTMLTTDTGHRYGEQLAEYQSKYVEWMREQVSSYNRNKASNPGRKKYNAKKKRFVEQIHSYINHELNQFLQTEKPQIVYIAKLPKARANGPVKSINYSVTMWQRGYIRKQLIQKCKEHSVEIVEVMGKDISNECSNCGNIGNKKEGLFICPSCGYIADLKINTAQNAKKRGENQKTK